MSVFAKLDTDFLAVILVFFLERQDAEKKKQISHPAKGAGIRDDRHLKQLQDVVWGDLRECAEA